MCLFTHRRPGILSLLVGVIVLFSLTAAAQTPYDDEFAVLRERFSGVQGIGVNAAELQRAYSLRDLVTDRASLLRWFESISANAEHPLIQEEACRFAQRLRRSSGDVTAQIRPRSAGLLLAAGDAASARPQSADALEALGVLKLEGSERSALQHLEEAVRLQPTAAGWLIVASACQNSLCRFGSLQNALRLDPHHRATLLALAEYYVAREQRTKARDALRLLLTRHPRDFVARKRLADLFMQSGAARQALASYDALHLEFPGPAWLQRELAHAYERAGLLDRALPLAEAAFEQNRDGSIEQEQLLRIHERRRDSGAAIEVIQRILNLEPDDAGWMVRLAKSQASSGNTEVAERTLRSVLARDSSDSEARVEQAELLIRRGRNKEAEAEFGQALASNHRLENVRRRLKWLGTPADAADPDQQFLAKLDIPSDAAVAATAEKALALADVRIDRVQPNGLAASRVQQLFLINDEHGARQFSTRSVQYSPASESLRILHARVHKKDGRVLEAEDAGEQSVADRKTAMYYDVRSRLLRYPTVEPGDVVELDYRITPEAQENPYGDYFGSLVLLQGSLPARLRRYVLVTPANRQFYATERRVPSRIEEFVTADERVQKWEMREVPALPSEPRGPSATDVGAYVHVSTFAGWQDLGRWYANMVRPQLELDAPLRDVARRMLAEHPDEQQRIGAIHRFVLQNTHYVALEFGIYSYKPYPVSQVYARRFGDCKDKASLMVALLRATGVDAEFALVRTRRLGGVATEAASISLFNHAIAYVPKYDLYLDGTAEYAGSRELPLDDQGAMTLTVAADGSSALRQIPVTSTRDNYTRRVIRAGIRDDGSIEFSGTAHTRGEDAPGLRREYEISERRRESLRQSLAEVFPSIRVEDVELQGGNDLERDVQVSFRGVLDMFRGRHTVSVASSWTARRYLQTLAPLANRRQPLILPAGWGTEEEVTFDLPPTVARVELPRPRRVETPFGAAEFFYEQRGRELAVRTRVEFTQTHIAPSDYPAFREFCHTLDLSFRQEVKVTLQ